MRGSVDGHNSLADGCVGVDVSSISGCVDPVVLSFRSADSNAASSTGFGDVVDVVGVDASSMGCVSAASAGCVDRTAASIGCVDPASTGCADKTAASIGCVDDVVAASWSSCVGGFARRNSTASKEIVDVKISDKEKLVGWNLGVCQGHLRRCLTTNCKGAKSSAASKEATGWKSSLHAALANDADAAANMVVRRWLRMKFFFGFTRH